MSEMHSAALVSILLWLSGAPPVAATLEFVRPASIAGIESPLCVARSAAANQTFTAIEAQFVKPDTRICHPSTASAYNGTIVATRHLEAVCGVGGRLASRRLAVYELAEAAQLACLVELLEAGNERNRVSGTNVFMYESVGIGNRVPYVQCDFALQAPSSTGEPLPAFYLNEVVFSNDELILAKVTLDHNPWIDLFESALYIAAFRTIGALYLFTGMLSAKWAKQRWAAPSTGHVPEILLTMEAVFMTVLGIHLILGGQCQSTLYPLDLHLAGFNFLTGSGCATSLLAGIYFKDIADSCSKMRTTAAGGWEFWKRNSMRVGVGIIICMCLDIFSAIGGIYFIDGIEKSIAGVNALLNLCLSIAFVRMSWTFIFGVMMKTAKDSKRRSSKVSGKAANLSRIATRMARLLFISAFAKLLLTLGLMPIMALSGTVITGFWDPKLGWPTTWIGMAVLRWVSSMCQVLMSAPKDRNKQSDQKDVSMRRLSSTSLSTSMKDSGFMDV